MRKAIYKQYEEYLKNKRIVEKLKKEGFVFIRHKRTKKVILGLCVASVGLLTPFTNWLLIPLSVWICGFSKIDIKNKYIPEIVRRLKVRCKK